MTPTRKSETWQQLPLPELKPVDDQDPLAPAPIPDPVPKETP